MRTYSQLTPGERYVLGALIKQGWSQRAVARYLQRDPSTVSRELRRNRRPQRRYDASTAIERANGRRSRSRRNRRFTAEDWALVVSCLELRWSPEQISGRLRRDGLLRISHETIYRHIWADKRRGGRLYLLLRQVTKKRRKRYGQHDSRGRLPGKRHISERPPAAHNRTRVGHWEGDTVMGSGDKHCILTLVDRKTGYTMIGKLRNRTTATANARAISLLRGAARPVRTLTVDNGTEFHSYREVEAATGTRFFFATPHHSWERGTSENTNGLIRQYLPKRKSMARVSQADCDRIAHALNSRPRKRLGFLTPSELYDRP